MVFKVIKGVSLFTILSIKPPYYLSLNQTYPPLPQIIVLKSIGYLPALSVVITQTLVNHGRVAMYARR